MSAQGDPSSSGLLIRSWGAALEIAAPLGLREPDARVFELTRDVSKPVAYVQSLADGQVLVRDLLGGSGPWAIVFSDPHREEV